MDPVVPRLSFECKEIELSSQDKLQWECKESVICAILSNLCK